ncbi:MAG: metallophosphoesterase [Kiritimatiellae bacterium]|nr:metallophosphoesterase [Kiritimatiellia bacterium]
MSGAPMLDRRGFLMAGAASLLAGRRLFAFGTPAGKPVVRFGMVTDLHYADIDPDPAPCGVVGRRFYRESLRKLREAVAVFNARRPDFAIELGDFKDLTRGRDETIAHLESIEAAFAGFDGPRYHVAGNHDFDCLSPDDFFPRLPNDGKPSRSGYYSFVRGGITFIVLNACFDSSLKPYSRANPWNDANVPPEELAWFERELSAAKGHVFVFCHQRLEDSAEHNHIVKNAAAVRALMERSGKVKGVITGHQHCGGANVVNGIPYYSLRALVCGSGEGNNSFAETAIYADGAFTVTGWRNAVSRGARGEFPARGLAARCDDPAAQGAAMADFVIEPGVAALEASLAPFPKTGRYLNIRCKAGGAATEAAELLRRTGRLAQGVLMMDSRDDLVALKKKCPWAKTGLVMTADAGSGKSWTEEEAWRKLKDAAKIGVEFVQIPPGGSCTRDQFVFLHDLGIRTVYFAANDAETLRAKLQEGHDFIFTDRLSELIPVFAAAEA